MVRTSRWKVTKPRKDTFKCQSCHRELPVNRSGASGYAVTGSGRKICYECAGKKEEKEVGKKGSGEKHVFYLSKKDGKYSVINWPGTLRYTVTAVKSGRHNMAGTRTDVWFKDHLGREWHGTNIGDNDLLRAKRLK
jgi:hypothetical protein